MTINELNTLIIEWAKERELDTKGTVEAQAIKTVEELSELIKAICKDKKEDIIDSIGDVYVTLVIGNMLKRQRELDPMFARKNTYPTSDKESLLKVLANAIDLNLREPYDEQIILYTMKDLHIVCKFYNLDFVECVESAYNTIKNRHGVMIDGVYVKDEDLASGAAQKATPKLTNEIVNKIGNEIVKNFTNSFTNDLY